MIRQDCSGSTWRMYLERRRFAWSDGRLRCKLPKAERAEALLLINGMSNAEIARMRDTRAGTIKDQSAAIYRKAGVNSCADLIGGLAISECEAAQARKNPSTTSMLGQVCRGRTTAQA